MHSVFVFYAGRRLLFYWLNNILIEMTHGRRRSETDRQMKEHLGLWFCHYVEAQMAGVKRQGLVISLTGRVT